MNAPVIWIVIPLLVAVGLWFARSKRFIVAVIASAVCLVLSILAWLFPFASLIRIGPLMAEISPTFIVLGRRFVLEDGDRFLLVFLYAMGAFWFFGEGVLRKHLSFVPLGLVIITLAIAALAVEPFLYAALILQILVLISIPLLVPPGRQVGSGVLRYLIFQTLGMVLILFAGWAAGGVEANPNDLQLTSQALIFLGLGFAFWLAVFPFHTWIPSMSSETRPFQMGFLLAVLPQAVLLLLLDFLNGFAWLRQFSGLPQVLQLIGVIMITAGGIWAAFQREIARLIGYATIVEIGFSLLALSLGTGVGYEIYVCMFFPRVLSLLILALSLSALDVEGDQIDAYSGLLKKNPVKTVSILGALLSLSGVPLLAAFPLRQVLLENLAQQSTRVLLWSLVGSAGLMIATIRFMIVFFSSSEGEWNWKEDWRFTTLLLVGLIMLVLSGLMPKWYVNFMQHLLEAFNNLLVFR